MNLPFFTKKQPESDEAYYLTLLLTHEKASAVILHEHLGKVSIIGRHEEYAREPIEALDQDSLINLIDKTVSRAEEVLPPQIETHKTVFGVKPEWIEPATQKIKKEYLAKLKKVCEALDLIPVGFMVVTEAISHLLQEDEGAPLSAILVEIGHQKITLTLFRGGKAIESIEGEREGEPTLVVDKLLHHFTIPALPARIILFDSHEIAKLSQSFIAHQWSKSLPFIHVPQITVLKPGFDARAVAAGAMTQMGLTLVKELSQSKVNDYSDEEFTEAPADVLPPVHKENASEPLLEESEPASESQPLATFESAPEEKPESMITADNFGFVSNQEISEVKKPHTEHATHHAVVHASGHQAHHEPVIHHGAQATTPVHHSLQTPEADYDEPEDAVGLVAGLQDRFKGIKLPHVSLPQLPKQLRKGLVLPIALVAGMVLLIGGIIYYYFYQMQATVVVAVTPKMVEETSPVTFSSTAPSDFSDNTIAAKTISQSITGEVSIDTTGKKEVGDKAKGTVTLYNNDDNKAELSSSTSIKSSNGMTFVLDKDIVIASASGDIFSGTKPGTTDVAVTAKDIGTDANLPSGTKFTVGGNSNLAGKNDSAFSGGTKKQVTVVSKDDLAKLRTELTKSLESKAKDQLSQKAGGDETLLPFIITAGLEKPKYDKDVDDEAKKVKLVATVVFEGLAYQNTELTDYAKSLMKNKYDEESVFADDTIKADVRELKQKGKDAVSGTIAIQGGMLPNIKPEDVVERLQGRSLKEANTILADLPQVGSSQITFSPNIPLLPNLFPKLPNHITVEIRSE